MNREEKSDTAQRFTGLAGVYARNRPSYPEAAVDYVVRTCGLGPGSVVVDVGCGTGISSRLFADRGLAVVGIEPNAEMRLEAERCESPSPPAPLPRGERGEGASGALVQPAYRYGRADATGLADQCADLVLAAQAFHWFANEETLREFCRILKPGGWVALMWNERDEKDPFTGEYGRLIRALPEAERIEGPRAQVGATLLRSPLFQDGRKVDFANEQVLSEEGLLGRSFSMSYAPRDAEAVESFAASLRDLFARHQQGGCVVVRYVTSLYLARRRAETDLGIP
jgi:SAM-dependent methyltransferase